MNPTSVRRSLYGKLAGDTTLTALLHAPPAGYSKSIFYQEAGENAGFPYVIFQKQAGTPTHAMKGGANAYKADVWLIKGVDHGTSADTAEAIAARLDALLTDASLSISGETLSYLRPDSDVNYAEITDGETYQHAGLLFRLIHQ